MDAGVGSFIMTTAIVSKAAVTPPTSAGASSKKAISASLFVRMLFFGFLRLMTTKGAQYQEHVTEYGVHWNFFFTLAAVMLAGALAQKVLPWRLFAPTGLALACSYQFALSNLGLAEYIKTAERTTLISMNREGLCGSIGFISIYLIAVGMGQLVVAAPGGGELFRRRSWWGFFLRLAALDAVLWIAAVLVRLYVDDVSRRMVNLAYILWVCAHNLLMLLLLFLVDLLLPPLSPQLAQDRAGRRLKPDEVCYLAFLYSCLPFRLLHSLPATFTRQALAMENKGLLVIVNSRQFPVFLLANIMTGAINLSMKTIYAEAHTAYIVICLYMSTLCLGVLAMPQADERFAPVKTD
jgi:phosphatidylinositol glycan class W